MKYAIVHVRVPLDPDAIQEMVERGGSAEEAIEYSAFADAKADLDEGTADWWVTTEEGE